MITIENKLLLRKANASDLESLYILKNDVDSNAMLGQGFYRGYSKEDMAKWIEFHNNATNEVLFVIQDIQCQKLIGHVGLYNIDYRNRKAEFAILIADKESRGKGYGKLCTQFMVSYGYEQLNLNRVELSVIEDNPIAISLYEKIGFEKEGLLKQSLYKNGKYHNVVLMAKLK